MVLNTKILTFLWVLALGRFSLNVAVASDDLDLDDTLKQALFLVKLLKTDFTQVLRANDGVTTNSTEEENSTCAIPADSNTTIAMNETEVTVSGVSSTHVASMTPSTHYPPPPPMPVASPGAPMMVPNTPPAGPMMMPYGNWPAMPMGYPPPSQQASGPGRQNFPDENYRFPYRFNRRRMVPDYYYFDSPVKSRGNFRRFGNDPTDDLGNIPATSQPQTTTSLTSATSEATTLHVGETTASTTSLTTAKSQPSTSVLPTSSANQSILPTISANHSNLANSANQTILPTNSDKQSIQATADSASKSILPTSDLAKLAILPETTKSVLTTAKSTKRSILPTTRKPKLSKIIAIKNWKNKTALKTKPRKRVRNRKRVPVSKAKTTVISNRNGNHHNLRTHHLRQHTTTTTTTTEKNIDNVETSEVASEMEKDNVEMFQVASELEKELDENSKDTSNGPDGHKELLKVNLAEPDRITSIRVSKTTEPDGKFTIRVPKRTTTSTMKVFLSGSSRIPLPFPENNAFCHFHPKNALCGTNL